MRARLCRLAGLIDSKLNVRPGIVSKSYAAIRADARRRFKRGP